MKKIVDNKRMTDLRFDGVFHFLYRICWTVEISSVEDFPLLLVPNLFDMLSILHRNDTSLNNMMSHWMHSERPRKTKRTHYCSLVFL